MRLTASQFVFTLSALLSTSAAASTHIEEQREAWKPYHREVEPPRVADRFLVPFLTCNRTDHRTVKVISRFGAGRRSYIRGHIHSGADLNPEPGAPGTVMAMADGAVCSIHLDHPHQTVVVQHLLPGGDTLFTSYKHLAEVRVELGQQVTPQTEVGRMYTAAEARELGGPYDHLHLEVRRAFDDYGVASWATMTQEQLNQRFLDPQTFLREQLKRAPPDVLVINPEREVDALDVTRPLLDVLGELGMFNIGLLHYRKVSASRVKRLDPKAVIIAGQQTPWREYSKTELARVKKMIRVSRKPLLGICGGHQLIGLAFGMRVGPVRAEDRGKEYKDMHCVRGTQSYRVVERDPLLEGLAEQPNFHASHCEAVHELHKDFKALMTGEAAGVAMFRHRQRPIFGTQFHLELRVEGGGQAGQILLRNFLK